MELLERHILVETILEKKRRPWYKLRDVLTASEATISSKGYTSYGHNNIFFKDALRDLHLISNELYFPKGETEFKYSVYPVNLSSYLDDTYLLDELSGTPIYLVNLNGFTYLLFWCEKHKNHYWSREDAWLRGERNCKGCYTDYLNSEELLIKKRTYYLENHGMTQGQLFSSRAHQDKCKKTSQERYGASHFSKTEKFLETTKKTNMLKYGVDNVWKTKEFREANGGTFHSLETAKTKLEEIQFEKLFNVTLDRITGDNSKDLMVDYHYTSYMGEIVYRSLPYTGILEGNYSIRGNKSFQEDQVFYILVSAGLKVLRQKRVTLKSGKRLYYDFYIKSLNYLIEYDGSYHREPVYGQESLINCQKMDAIKDRIAGKIGCKMLRINSDEVFSRNFDEFNANLINLLKREGIL